MPKAPTTDTDLIVLAREGEEDAFTELVRRHQDRAYWIAFNLLEQDIHHRSDIFHYLALLGIEHPEVGTP